ncbi:MAG: NAD-dependent epimerase/dehydratase family protein [Gammaproteobacteria bacterium]|nr:NAD-dependent epimerase/dehydratase family protein [Gammaproteobacteria bacterium]MDH3467954.1 NAD-dependent epimerase/dehydratase family protein [Gammaproteobacteria bacterium]
MNVLVTGAGGFIGHHLVRRLKSEGHYVVGADRKAPEYEPSAADRFFNVDLRFKNQAELAFQSVGKYDEVYMLAANMGGMGFIETHKAEIMYDNTLISLNSLECAKNFGSGRVFFAGSACVYNTDLQTDHKSGGLSEEMAYPARAEPGYGWEKLYTEMLCQHYREDFGLETRVARLHNVYGELGAWRDGREKAPAAICRKVIMADRGGEVEIWGDGGQSRSFQYITDCIEGITRIIRGDYPHPLNLGSDQAVTINELFGLAMDIEKKQLTVSHIDGPLGVRSRNSDNSLIKKELGWAPSVPLERGLRNTYFWIKEQIEHCRSGGDIVDAASTLLDTTEGAL